ncbi:artemin [Alosa alosa]|uniref:artemin n=1 Tax=Alosa alosa TaxID=278164 RepID=UPI0020153503|nr:artemin [Alosa alosa]
MGDKDRCIPASYLHIIRILIQGRDKENTTKLKGQSAGDGEGTRAAREAGASAEELHGALALRSRRSASDVSCSLQSLLVQVRDLGLGYDSDEMVRFKYCAGACPLQRSNHDLTLANLLQAGHLRAAPAGQMWHSMPCCRPTHHEDMVFLDNAHRWHKVEKLSAAGCACIG